MHRFSNVLTRPAPVDLDAAIAALARRDGVRIMPHGLVAANQLSLTNAVPAKVCFVTDGHSRTVKIEGRTVLTILSRHLPDDVKRNLLQNSRDLPSWALPLARNITSDQAVAV